MSVSLLYWVALKHFCLTIWRNVASCKPMIKTQILFYSLCFFHVLKFVENSWDHISHNCWIIWAWFMVRAIKVNTVPGSECTCILRSRQLVHSYLFNLLSHCYIFKTEKKMEKKYVFVRSQTLFSNQPNTIM